jgi:phage terminase Nu1 subunit (DNA packaging protein)
MTNEWTVAQWSREVGGDRHEWAKRIAEIGIKPVGKATGRSTGAELYRVRDLLKAAIGGDIEAERLRKTKEEADKLALANARSRGEVVEVASVKRLGEKVMAAVRNRILSMPMTDEEKDGCLRELLSLSDMDWTRDA